MRRVWFVFKLFEAILGLFCLGYHTRGFLNVDYVQSHYTYCAIFGGFTLMAMFGCLSVCMMETLHPLWEGSANLLAAISLIGVSLDSMFHAEKDFYLTYLAAEEDADGKEPHPFFKYSKAQSVAALCCGCLFMLHSVLAFDLALVDVTNDESASDTDDEIEGPPQNARRINFYVFGKLHKWLEKYEWFYSLSDSSVQMRSEESRKRRETI